MCSNVVRRTVKFPGKSNLCRDQSGMFATTAALLLDLPGPCLPGKGVAKLEALSTS